MMQGVTRPSRLRSARVLSPRAHIRSSARAFRDPNLDRVLERHELGIKVPDEAPGLGVREPDQVSDLKTPDLDDLVLEVAVPDLDEDGRGGMSSTTMAARTSSRTSLRPRHHSA
jgi:hypothetical protein